MTKGDFKTKKFNKKKYHNFEESYFYLILLFVLLSCKHLHTINVSLSNHFTFII